MSRGFQISRVSWALALMIFINAVDSATAVEPRSSAKTPNLANDRAVVDRLVQRFRKGTEDERLLVVAELSQNQRGSADLPKALWQVLQPELKRKPLPPSTVAAAELFASLEAPGLSDEQLGLTRSPDLRIATLTVRALAERKVPEALDRTLELAKRPEFSQSYGFRHTLTEAAGKFHDPKAVEFLVDVTGRFDGQLRYDTAVRLSELTGQRFGGHADQWRQWWQSHRNDKGAIVPANAVSSSASSTSTQPQASTNLPWPTPVPKFYEVPVFAKRVVFVIDRSKSMLSSVDGVTRLDEAQYQIEQCIRGLAEDTYFNIVVYNERVEVWSQILNQATTMNKSDAIGFAFGLNGAGKTATYDALETALRQDPNLEAILFLSDGKPTAGKIPDPRVIVFQISAQNALQQTAIHTIGIDTRGQDAEFLAALAAQNRGTFRNIR